MAQGVTRLGAEIARDYPDGPLLVAVLKGSVPFVADLVRAMPALPTVEFMAISSYAPNTGRVRIVKDVEVDIYDRDVILVEDIVDTGLTLTFLLTQLEQRRPRSLATCALLNRDVRRIVPTPLEYRGFDIGDEFVLGYGLDYAERYRNLDRVVVGDLKRLREDPDAYVAEVYNG